MSLRDSSVSLARKCYNKNTIKSPLYALPYEFLVVIHEHLDPTEKACFALSGAKLFETFPSINIPASSHGDARIGVYLRLMRDDFYKDPRNRSSVWCVYCADLHDSSSFIGDMHCYPRWDRMCSPSLQLCPHRGVSLDQLRSRIAKPTILRGGPAYLDLRCEACDKELDKTSRIFMNQLAIKHDEASGDYVLRTFIQINFEKASNSGLHTKARKDLQKIDFPACLHMKTPQESTIDRLVDAKTGAFKAEQQDKAYRVHREHCRTMICTKAINFQGPRILYPRGKNSGLRLDIIRNLGKLKSEDDPVWRAHLRERQLKVTQDQGELSWLEWY